MGTNVHMTYWCYCNLCHFINNLEKDPKTPPALTKDIPYERWKKEIKLWQMITKLENKKQAPAVILGLDGNAREAGLELDIEVLTQDDGMTKLVDKLDTLYEKDRLLLAIDSWEDFESYQRPPNMKISEYVIEFEKRYNKAKLYDMNVNDGVLAHRFLKSSNVSEHHQQLVKATLTEMTYTNMKKQLSKVFMETGSSNMMDRSNAYVPPVKLEPVYAASTSGQDTNETYYGYQYNDRGKWHGSSNRRPAPRYRGNNRGRGSRGTNKYSSMRQLNPLDEYGEVSKCAICGSNLHWARNCQHSYEALSAKDSGSGGNSKSILYCKVLASESLVGESLGAATLDSGCTKTCSGVAWTQSLLETMDEEDLAKVHFKESNAAFRFGNDEDYISRWKMYFPVYISGKEKMLGTEVIDAEVPLLLSEEDMGKFKMVIDFGKKTLSVNGVKSELFFTPSGHYCVSIGKKRVALENKDISAASVSLTSDLPIVKSGLSDNSEIEHSDVIRDSAKQVWLANDIFVEDMSKGEKQKVARKLHREFSHPPSKRLKSLLQDANIKDDELFAILSKTLPMVVTFV